MTRCFGDEDPLYAKYHDQEWGIPIHDDRKLFEMLILEGAQAGLSWITVLKRREAYRKAFHNFDPKKVARLSDAELEVVLQESNVIRNRLKVWSARQNAQVFLEIQNECGSFDLFLKKFFPKPIVNQWKKREQVPCRSDQADALSKELKRRGMKFVGPTIIYAFCQAVGLVNDHLTSCQEHLAPKR